MLDPSIHNLSIRGDRQAGLSYLPAAEKELRMLHARAKAAGIASQSRFARLSDTAYCYVRIAGDINIINIVVDSEDSPALPEDKYDEMVAPSILSGVIARTLAYKYSDKGTRFLDGYFPDANTQRLFELRAGEQENARLAVLPHSTIPGTVKNTKVPYQGGLKPTMWSGSMKRVVQLLLGLGYIVKDDIYFTSELQKGDKQHNKKIVKPTPYEQEVISNGYQIRYDYTWFRTHGITIGADGKHWLVEISNANGVIAMPLPINPLSTTERYAERAEKLGDRAVLDCLRQYGGVPSGEIFQSGKTLEAQIRAAQVVRLVEREAMNEYFSDLSAYSSACGWAFSLQGKEAHNTGYKDGPQHQVGKHFGVSISIGATVDPSSEEAAKDFHDTLKGFQSKYGYYRFKAAIHKLKYMDREEILQQRRLLRIYGKTRYMEMLDDLVVTPQAPCAGSFSLVGQGPLSGNGTLAATQLKFWEPNWPDGERCVISHDFGAPVSVDCDTTVFVYFKGDDLKTVKLYTSTKTGQPGYIDTGDMPGRYSEKFTGIVRVRESASGRKSVSRCYYSEDFDDRKEYDESVSGTTDYLESFGPSKWFISIPAYLAGGGSGYATGQRVGHYREAEITKYASSHTMVGATVCMPAYTREAFFYAFKEDKTWKEDEVRWKEFSLGDGNYIRFFTYSAPYNDPVAPHERRLFYEDVTTSYPAFTPLIPFQKGDRVYPSSGYDSGGKDYSYLFGFDIYGLEPGMTWDNLPPLDPPGTPPFPPTRFDGELTIGIGWYEGAKVIRSESYGGVDARADDIEWWRMWHEWFEPSPEVNTPLGQKGYLMTQWMTGCAYGTPTVISYQNKPDGDVVVEGATGQQYIDMPCFIGVPT